MGDLKTSVQEQKGEAYPANALVLIHQGKILKNETTLAENGVADAPTSFLVMMVQKVDASEAFLYL